MFNSFFDIDFPSLRDYVVSHLLRWSLYIGFSICQFCMFVQTKSSLFYSKYLKPCQYTCRGIKITTNSSLVRPSFEIICNSPKFIQWLDRFPLDQFNLVSITMTDVNFFSKVPSPEKLGFLKFTCEVYTKSGEPLDGIVFLRGDSGGILIIPEDENGRKFVLLTKQPRIPICGMKEEIVAGMFDDLSGSIMVNEVLKKEIFEETGLMLDTSDPTYKQLGSYTLSAGGCDENIHLAVWRPIVTSLMLNKMKSRLWGQENSNEKIQIVLHNYDSFEEELPRIGDAKTSLAWYRVRGTYGSP